MFGLRRLLPFRKVRLPVYADPSQRDEILRMVEGHTEQKTRLQVGQSSIPNAGFGVTAACNLPADKIVTLYPGMYFPPLPMVLLADDAPLVELQPPPTAAVGSGGDYLINSAVGGFLDEPVEVTQAMQGGEVLLWCGHRVQHPPKGTAPNVDLIHFMWWDVLAGGHGDAGWREAAAGAVLRGSRLYSGRWFIDHRHALSEGKSREVLLPALRDGRGVYWRRKAGIAIATTRALEEGEELFLDYEYGPKKAATLPWYHPAQHE
jgi:hypothetical protein